MGKFSTDTALEPGDPDLLGRRPFADDLARAIARQKGRDGLVVALNGAWGCGKSSIVTMCLEWLDKQEEPKVKVIPLNPWMCTSQEQLIEYFFNEIGDAIGAKDRSADGAERASKWKRYGAYFALGGMTVRGLGTVGNVFMPGVSVATETVAKELEKLSGAAKVGAEGIDNEQSKSLATLKKELSNQLLELPAPLLVVIDDIDRLTANEIALLFQLVKTNANFPNIIYLLLFQRDIVEAALVTVAPQIRLAGRKFLEKIVQVSFDVPAASGDDLARILKSELAGVLQFEETKFANNQRWKNLLNTSSIFFTNLRDVRRFINSFAFHIDAMTSSGFLEVDAVDLAALEILRVFEPDVYRLILIHQEFLLNPHSVGGMSDDQRKQNMRSVAETFLNNATDSNRQAVGILLGRLFPLAAPLGFQVYVERGDALSIAGDLLQTRVCHREMFPRYFRFRLNDTDLSQLQLNKLRESVTKAQSVQDALKQLSNSGLKQSALDHLAALCKEGEVNDLLPVLVALANFADEAPTESDAIEGCFISILRGLPVHMNQREVGKTAVQAFRQAGSFYIPALMAIYEENASDPSRRMFDNATLSEMKAHCILQLEEEKVRKRLLQYQKLPAILLAWVRWGNISEAHDWVVKTCQDHTKLFTLLNSFTSDVYGFDPLNLTEDLLPRYGVNIDALSRVTDLGIIFDVVNGIDDAKIRAEEQKIKTLFLEAYRIWQEQGKGNQLGVQTDSEALNSGVVPVQVA